MALVAKKLEGETWKQAALRYAAKCGLEAEVEAEYNAAVARGAPEPQAAWEACVEWDVADFEDRP